MSSAAPALGGRSVDAQGVNDGLVRCPRCSTRLLSECGSLVARPSGPDRVLWMPFVPTSDEVVAKTTGGAQAEGPEVGPEEVLLVEDAEEGGTTKGSTGDGGDATSGSADPAFEWKDEDHEFWWLVEDVNDFDNVGLSRLVQSPHGLIKVVLCSACGNGPFGHQRDGDSQIWVACNRTEQVDVSLRNDEEDFKPPEGIDLAALKEMIASGAATTRFHVVFDEQRLGMMLADVPGGTGGVHVHAFTVTDAGELGPAEMCKEINIGDVITKVNGKSTSGLDYAGVLDLVCSAPRPITLHFERSGKNTLSSTINATSNTNEGVARVRHWAWSGGVADKEQQEEQCEVCGGESKR
eukprot:g525.t1